MRRWISAVRPDGRCDSRAVRVFVARGSIAYSAGTQPRPLLRMNRGTRSSTDAVQITFVPPTSINAEPSAYGEIFGVILVLRIWSWGRLFVLMLLLN